MSRGGGFQKAPCGGAGVRSHTAVCRRPCGAVPRPLLLGRLQRVPAAYPAGGPAACGQGGGNKPLRGVAAGSHAPAPPAGAALGGGPGRRRGYATPHVYAVRRPSMPRAGSSRLAACIPAVHRGSQSAGARAPAPLCLLVEVSKGPRRGSEGSRPGWCRRTSAGGQAQPHSAVRASFAHHFAPRAGRRASAPRQRQ